MRRTREGVEAAIEVGEGRLQDAAVLTRREHHLLYLAALAPQRGIEQRGAIVQIPLAQLAIPERDKSKAVCQLRRRR